MEVKLSFNPTTRKILSLLLFGSGVVNVISASGQTGIIRQEFLLRLFPVEFVHVSKFITLVLGVALGIISINLYRRKKKAWQTAAISSLLSALFHLTKGLNFEQAIISLLIWLILILTRKEYLVESEKIDYKDTGIEVLIAVVLVLLYGVAGFWLLDQREFGLNFNIFASLQQTLKYLSFTPTVLLPQTQYARFFLNSLHWATIFLIIFFLSSFFAPVIFEFIENNQDRHKAKILLNKYGNSSLDFFKLWPDKSYFFSQDEQAFIAYGVKSNVAVALADPTGTKNNIEALIEDFARYCTVNGWRCVFHQVLPDYLQIYQKLGFKNFKIGDHAFVDLKQFNLIGLESRYFRKVINSFERNGFTVEKIAAPLSPAIMNELKKISDSWLEIPGRKERTFTLGFFKKDYLETTPVFVVKNSLDQMIAFANIIPSYAPGETTIDLMRYRQDAPNGTMDFLLIKLFLQLKKEGFTRFSLGLAPMSGFSSNEESSRAEKTIHRIAQNANFIFSFKGLKAYKAKYADYWEPRYLIYKNILDLPLLAKALRKLSEDKGEKTRTEKNKITLWRF